MINFVAIFLVYVGYYVLHVDTTFSTRENNNQLEGWTSVNLNGIEAGKAAWNWAPLYSLER